MGGLASHEHRSSLGTLAFARYKIGLPVRGWDRSGRGGRFAGDTLPPNSSEKQSRGFLRLSVRCIGLLQDGRGHRHAIRPITRWRFILIWGQVDVKSFLSCLIMLVGALFGIAI